MNESDVLSATIKRGIGNVESVLVRKAYRNGP